MSTPRESQGLSVSALDAAEYRALLERGQELEQSGTWVWFEREQRSVWSPNARAILGHGEEDVVWLFDLVHPDDQGSRSYDTFTTSAEPKTVEYRIFRHSDKALRWIRETGVAELDEAGRPIRVFGSITDVTEQHLESVEGRRGSEGTEVRNRLQLEPDFQDLFEQSMDGVLFSRPDGTVLAANPAACEILGMTEAEICTRGRAGLADPSDERWAAGVAERARTGRFRGDLRMLRGDGSAVTVEVTSRIFVGPDGDPRTCIIFRGITERPPLAEQLRKAAAFEEANETELALDTYLRAGQLREAGRLLPAVIVQVVERHDLELAERYLADVPIEPEPSRVVLARLMLASIKQAGAEGLAVLERLEQGGDLARVVREEPVVGALACNFYLAGGRLEQAVSVLDAMPPGRAADAARLLLSGARDDPRAPIPPFSGDVLDAVIARGLFCRGKLESVRRPGGEAFARASGIPELARPDRPDDRGGAPLGASLSRFGRAVDERDLEGARQAVAELDLLGARTFTALAEAELAVRLERDPAHAYGVIERLRSLPTAPFAFYDELADTWEGAALLLAGDDGAAAEILERAVASMRRGDRTLELAAALVYLAEAAWRLEREEAADLAIEEAYAVARANGAFRRFHLALADFPGVLSRRLDLEAAPDGEWHRLGRALALSSSSPGSASVARAVVHLREFGEPALVVEGKAIRPKIRKSLELLSFLLSRPQATASRQDVLTALWDGRDDDASRAYLRQAVRHLRDVLPEQVTLASAGDSLSIRGGVASEVAELDRLLLEAAREQGTRRRQLLLDALSLGRRGLFFEGTGNVVWVDERRARIESLLVDARLDTAELLLEESRFQEALALADEVLEQDVMLERGWRVRMKALGMLGDADGVADAYRKCRAALAKVDLEPSPATLQLARQLRH